MFDDEELGILQDVLVSDISVQSVQQPVHQQLQLILSKLHII